MKYLMQGAGFAVTIAALSMATELAAHLNLTTDQLDEVCQDWMLDVIDGAGVEGYDGDSN